VITRSTDGFEDCGNVAHPDSAATVRVAANARNFFVPVDVWHPFLWANFNKHMMNSNTKMNNDH
jgi:hypothetical protein